MRPDLRNMSVQVSDLWVSQLSDTVELCAGLNTSHWQYTHEPFRDGDMENQEFIEALSDQNVRTAHETHFVWQFGLWRLQAIFEGLVSQDLLGGEDVRGLGRKLNWLEARGFTLSPDERAELMRWANLRNALSHRPVHATSVQQQLYRTDLEELAALLTTLIERWRQEATAR